MKKVVALIPLDMSNLLARYLSDNGITYTGLIKKLLREFISVHASEFTELTDSGMSIEQICKGHYKR